MPIEIIGDVNRKPASSAYLVDLIQDRPSLTGQLYFAFPVIGSLEGRHVIDAILITPKNGIIVFDLVESALHIGDYHVRQDESANKLESRLKLQQDLHEQRDLLVPISTISFAPAVNQLGLYAQSGYPLVNSNNLFDHIESTKWINSSHDIYFRTLSAIQNITTIRKPRVKRIVTNPSSRGDILSQLEDSIATFDSKQIRAVLETLDGIQRIRGLAGSGKTVVLAAKAAYLHTLYPDWLIAVTFKTRSLKGHFRHLINRFAYASGIEPDYNKLRILTSWGAPGGGEREGIYHEICTEHNVTYYDFKTARQSFTKDDTFEAVCAEAFETINSFRPKYDAMLIDEAQDLPVDFLRLCYLFTKPHKRYVYAYDELQNLTEDSLPPPQEFLQGLDSEDTVGGITSFDSNDPGQDIILPTCYRNSKPILTTAHALGFGIYRKPTQSRETGLIQMFDHPPLWTDIGYRIKDGSLADGQLVNLERTAENSPDFLANHSTVDDLIRFEVFDSEQQQADWLVQQVTHNLTHDELRPEDIMIINPDPRTTRQRTAIPRSLLYELKINTHLAGVDTKADVFIPENSESVVFTGIHRAKGNEAAMVYIINAQDCYYSPFNLANIRNQLFTAITRSKAWVRILGVGSAMKHLTEEYQRLKQHNFELRFVYPTSEQRKQLRIVHRDITEQDRQRIDSKDKQLQYLIDDLEKGVLHVEDLDKNVVDKLRSMLS